MSVSCLAIVAISKPLPNRTDPNYNLNGEFQILMFTIYDEIFSTFPFGIMKYLGEKDDQINGPLNDFNEKSIAFNSQNPINDNVLYNALHSQNKEVLDSSDLPKMFNQILEKGKKIFDICLESCKLYYGQPPIPINNPISLPSQKNNIFSEISCDPKKGGSNCNHEYINEEEVEDPEYNMKRDFADNENNELNIMQVEDPENNMKTDIFNKNNEFNENNMKTDFPEFFLENFNEQPPSRINNIDNHLFLSQNNNQFTQEQNNIISEFNFNNPFQSHNGRDDENFDEQNSNFQHSIEKKNYNMDENNTKDIIPKNNEDQRNTKYVMPNMKNKKRKRSKQPEEEKAEQKTNGESVFNIKRKLWGYIYYFCFANKKDDEAIGALKAIRKQKSARYLFNKNKSLTQLVLQNYEGCIDKVERFIETGKGIDDKKIKVIKNDQKDKYRKILEEIKKET